MKNKNDVNVMLREAGILFAITLIAGLVLGFVYELTKEPIRIQQEKKIQKACAAVFETAAQFDETSYTPDEAFAAELAADGVQIGTVYEAKDANDGLLGYVLQSTSTEGYGGSIVIYMGVTLDGTLNKISFLQINETPGLGMRADKVLTPQLTNKKVSQFTYTKTGSTSDSEIDAISGATFTTEAVMNAVNGGLKTAEKLIQGGGSNE